MIEKEFSIKKKELIPYLMKNRDMFSAQLKLLNITVELVERGSFYVMNKLNCSIIARVRVKFDIRKLIFLLTAFLAVRGLQAIQSITS